MPFGFAFGSLMHLTIIDNQFVYAPAYEIGPRGGITVRNNMDVTSDNRHAVPEKIKANELEPTDKVWIVTGDGKIEQITGDAYNRTPPVTGPLIRLPSGEYLPALQYNQVMDALAMEAGKGGKKRTIGVQGADGVTRGLAAPVDIRDCLELNDPKLATEDVPAPASLENPDIDGLVPSDHVSST